MKTMLGLIIFLLVSIPAFAEEIDYNGLPVRCKEYIPILLEQVDTYWSDMEDPALFCAQVEQETCPSLTNKKCWNPHAELKTSREYGFGLGQITITKAFNNFEEMRSLSRDLKHWEWRNRYDANKQLEALVLYNRRLWLQLKNAEEPTQRYAMMFAAYNGGLGGVKQEISLCRSAKGCNPDIWFGNVELHSRKSRTKVHGYGQSFYDINREYVRNIIRVRPVKYRDAGVP